jgi:putative hydrolase of the HAD superfamily
MTPAVLFDVDFTLITPGPMFRAEGYRAFGARHGVAIDASRFDAAVSSAAALLDDAVDPRYDAAIFVAYTRHILELMGGSGDTLDACAREIYDEWAACHHFELYDEVPAVLAALAADGVRLGLVSNSHRCLDAFQAHFALRGLISAAVSSPEHGFMKPHPSIFAEAVRRLDVRPGEALMVGDSVRHDVEGALLAGLRAALVHRADDPHPRADELAARGVPILRTLHGLRSVL